MLVARMGEPHPDQATIFRSAALARVARIAVALFMPACSGGSHDVPRAPLTASAKVSSVSATSAPVPVRELTMVEAILEKRALFTRLDGDAAGRCEPLAITLPDLLDESHGTLQVPWAGPGKYELPFVVKDGALELSAACVTSAKSSLCLPCRGAGTVSAYARGDVRAADRRARRHGLGLRRRPGRGGAGSPTPHAGRQRGPGCARERQRERARQPEARRYL